MRCISETRKGKARVENLKSRLGFDRSFVVASSGRSGGLGIFWDDEIKLEVKGSSMYHIDCVVSGLGNDPWRMTTSVYGDAQVQDHNKTWDRYNELPCFASMCRHGSRPMYDAHQHITQFTHVSASRNHSLCTGFHPNKTPISQLNRRPTLRLDPLPQGIATTAL